MRSRGDTGCAIDPWATQPVPKNVARADLPGLTNAQSKTIESPWGKPSGPLLTGKIAGLPIVFLSRHDKGRRLSPSDILPRQYRCAQARRRNRSRFTLGLRLVQGRIAAWQCVRSRN
jgi:hypothetical protein